MLRTPVRVGLLLGLVLTLVGGVRVAADRASGAAAEGHGWLLVANKGDRSLSIIDPTIGQQVAAVPVGGVTGHEVTASPDGARAYVPIYGNSGVGKPGTDGQTMAVIDLATRSIIRTVDFGKGVRPHHPVIGPKDGLLYVTTELDNTITILDPKTLKVVGTVPTGKPESHMLAISKDGRRGYTANVGNGTVSVLDLEKRTTLAIVPISANTQRIALSVDGRWVFTADQTSPRLAVLSTATNTIEKWVTLPGPGYGTAPTPDGRYLVVAVPTANKVAIVDLTSFEVTKVLDVPAAPQESLVAPDGKMAYVSCDAAGKVAAIRTSDWTVTKLIDAGKTADGLGWAVSH
jgi:YVTN family beta-propeller protein